MFEQTQTDYLTGFIIRGGLNPLLERLVIEANLENKNFSVALVDLDHFKKFNDKFGHTFGDEVLKYATGTLRLTFYESQCYFFRYGGDEFIVVFPEKKPKEILPLFRQCSYNLLHRPFLFANKFYKITISCGIAGFPLDAKTVEELIEKADKAMYFSKRHGRNKTTLASMIRYLELRGVFVLIGTIGVILSAMLIFYQSAFKKIIQPVISKIKNVRIVPKAQDLDTVILKNGIVFEGRIVTETEDKVILNLYLEKGEGLTTFNKSEIAQIKHGSKIYP
jgi:diguanylate cyclase (GGDEF)-like protein